MRHRDRKALVAPTLARSSARAPRSHRHRRPNDDDARATRNPFARTPTPPRSHRASRATSGSIVRRPAPGPSRSSSRHVRARPTRCTHQQESGDVFHPCCEVLLKCVRVFVAEEFDSCLSLQRADDSRAHKRRTARARGESCRNTGCPSVCVYFYCTSDDGPRVCHTRGPSSLRRTIRVYSGSLFSFSDTRYALWWFHYDQCIDTLATRALDGRSPDPRRGRRPSTPRRRPHTRVGRTEAGRARWRVGFTARCTANRW